MVNMWPGELKHKYSSAV